MNSRMIEYKSDFSEENFICIAIINVKIYFIHVLSSLFVCKLIRSPSLLLNHYFQLSKNLRTILEMSLFLSSRVSLLTCSR